MKSRTYIVRFVKEVYADVVVELPEEGFSAEFAITAASTDINKLSVKQAIRQRAVQDEGSWQFHTVGLTDGNGATNDLIAQFVIV
jgi:hypothetical protein